MGRIPVQATLLDLHDVLCKLSWSFDDVALVAASFVDNVYFAGGSPYKATQMGDLFAQRLLSQWGQSVKQGSQQVLVMHGARDDSTSSFDWQVCDNMSVLGHQIQNNGSVLMDFNMTKIKLWRSFWRNAGTLQARRLPLRYRITLLKRATQPVADQHMLR